MRPRPRIRPESKHQDQDHTASDQDRDQKLRTYRARLTILDLRQIGAHASTLQM